MKLQFTIQLPASKSESNRALMIAAYGGFAPDFQNLSDSKDTLVLSKALRCAQQGESQIDISDCGTAARFMTTYLASHEGNWLLTGSQRMRQRPMAPLVETLLSLGAEIQYAEKQGFLPLQISGRSILGGKVTMVMSQSSQFASSLLLAAPMWPQGLEMELLGDLNSFPYLDMTLAMMRHFGAEVELMDRTITVRPKPYHPNGFMVSSDWSSASYWYEIAAFSEDCEIRLQSLSLPKGRMYAQGDSIITEWMNPFGVLSTEVNNSIVLCKKTSASLFVVFDASYIIIFRFQYFF